MARSLEDWRSMRARAISGVDGADQTLVAYADLI